MAKARGAKNDKNQDSCANFELMGAERRRENKLTGSSLTYNRYLGPQHGTIIYQNQVTQPLKGKRLSKKYPPFTL
jgi:hypothetical protein